MSLFRVSADPHVNGLIEKCGYATAALTIIPIPGSEVIGVMPLHVGMVVGIAHHHGQNLTTETATELLIQIGTTVGASLLGSRVATTAAKFVLPGLGGIIAAPFMFASTLAIGAVADQWFNSGGTLSEIEMRALYERTVKSAKSSFQTDRMKDSGAMQQTLTGSRAAGLVCGTRYIHTVIEMIDKNDLAAARDLLAAWLPTVK